MKSFFNRCHQHSLNRHKEQTIDDSETYRCRQNNDARQQSTHHKQYAQLPIRQQRNTTTAVNLISATSAPESPRQLPSAEDTNLHPNLTKGHLIKLLFNFLIHFRGLSCPKEEEKHRPHNLSGFCYHTKFFSSPFPCDEPGEGGRKNLVLPRTCKQHSKSSYPSPSAPSRKDVSHHAGKISGCQEEMSVPKARRGQKYK